MVAEDLTISSHWIANRIHLILANNNPKVTQRLNRAACSAVLEGMGSTPPTRDAYDMMLHGRGDLRRSEVADAVGLAVCDEIRACLQRAGLPNPWGVLLEDLLDLGDAVQRRIIGDDWLPDTMDVDWPDGDDTDGDGDGE